MTNLREEIEKEAGNEPILGASIGRHDDYQYRKIDDPTPPDKMGKVLSWNKASEVLDYEYDDGFGGADCHPIFAWTATKVIFISEYDGSTTVTSVPRHPLDCWPSFSGGWNNDNV